MESEYAKEVAWNYEKARTEASIYREGRPKLSAIANLVDDMPMEMFLEYVAAGRIGSRKAFCEALGISESTLSGWVKEGRAPRYAQLILGLLMLLDTEEEQHGSTRAAWLTAANEDRVIHDGDNVLIASFEWRGTSHYDAHSIGKVVARGIESENVALRLISYQSMLLTLNEAARLLTPPQKRQPDGEQAKAADPKVSPDVQMFIETIEGFNYNYARSVEGPYAAKSEENPDA